MIKSLPELSQRDVFVFAIPATILFVVLSLCIGTTVSQQFSALAQSFLHGHSYFTSMAPSTPGMDGTLWQGKYYWAEGPLPTTVLMPFVGLFRIFNSFFYQGYLQWALVLGVVFFVFKLAKELRYSARDSLILALGFTLGSAFIGVSAVSSSWFFAQVLTTFLLFWSLYEFYTKKRWWLIGIICAMIMLTRISAAAILIFFALEKWLAIKQKPNKARALIPIWGWPLVAVILSGIYNYARFKNPLQSGYGLYQLMTPTIDQAKSYGIFSLIHIPGNLFSSLLSAPVPVFRDGVSHVLKFPYIANNPWGMSIFITSPYLLYLFTLSRRSLDRQSLRMLVSIFVSAAVVFSFYGIGYYQFGYRYSLDFMPLLFVLFMVKYRQDHASLSSGMKGLLLGSGLFNAYLLMSFIGAFRY